MTTAHQTLASERPFNLSWDQYPVSLLLLITVITAVHWPTSVSLYQEWMEAGAYSHGLLAVLVSAWLLHGDKPALQLVRTPATPFALVAVLGSSALWLVGHLADVLVVQQFALLVTLNLALLACYGISQYRHLLLIPVGSLAFVFPIWNFLTVPLQHAATWASHQVVMALGIPVFREGFLLTVPGGRFIVEEGCSGLGFLLTSTLLTIYMAKLNNYTTRAAIVFFVGVAAIAVVINWVRIVTIVLVGNATRMEHIIVQDHLMFGWVIFSLALLPMIYFGGRWRRPEEPAPVVRQASGQLTAAGFAAILALLALLPVLAQTAFQLPPDTDYDYKPPVALDGFRASHFRAAHWQPQFPSADSTHSASFSNAEGQQVQFRTINYWNQRQGKELIYYENAWFSEDAWHEEDDTTLTAEIANIVLRDNRGERLHIYYSWVVAGIATQDRRIAKILQVWGNLSGNPGASAISIALPSARGDKERPDELAQALMEQYFTDNAIRQL